ncbi:hypothetical protein pdam_00016792, partial [Pocillopora damicornis]
EMGKEAKKKNEKKVVPVSSTSLCKSVDQEGLCSILGGEEGQNISARESDYNDYSYGVEYARSGRALCRTCDSLIPN